MAYQIDYFTVYQLTPYIQHVIDGFHCKPPRSTSKVFKYMSATFDKKLLLKLCSIGIRARAFLWITKFLSNGYITVRYNGVLSERRKVLPGVPQGLALCSLLIIIYTMGLKNQLRNEAPVSKYADDIVLRCT